MRKASGLSVVSEGMAVKLAHLLKIVKSSAAFFEKTNFEALSFYSYCADIIYEISEKYGYI
jgi:hypothetical protein